jgi:hypothetical protein
MTRAEIRRRLPALGPMDFAAAEQLARDIRRDAREPLTAFPAMLVGLDDAGTANAETVARWLEELSILPWLAAAERAQGARRMRLLVEAYCAFRSIEERVRDRLRAALGDRAPIPVRDDLGPTETPVPVTRVCDEAYLLWRQLARPDEPELDRQRFRLRFARAPEADRDAAIARALAGIAP